MGNLYCMTGTNFDITLMIFNFSGKSQSRNLSRSGRLILDPKALKNISVGSIKNSNRYTLKNELIVTSVNDGSSVVSNLVGNRKFPDF